MEAKIDVRELDGRKVYLVIDALGRAGYSIGIPMVGYVGLVKGDTDRFILDFISTYDSIGGEDILYADGVMHLLSEKSKGGKMDGKSMDGKIKTRRSTSKK